MFEMVKVWLNRATFKIIEHRIRVELLNAKEKGKKNRMAAFSLCETVNYAPGRYFLIREAPQVLA